jgi:hypothetical protein
MPLPAPRPAAQHGFPRGSAGQYFRLILGGDQDSAQFGDHVEVRRVSFGGAPRRAVAAIANHVRVAAGEVVPNDHDALGVEAERHRPVHRWLAAVAGFADARWPGLRFGIDRVVYPFVW